VNQEGVGQEGPGFDGRRAACGLIFDQNEMTAASNTFKCNTTARVTSNGRTITVKVTGIFSKSDQRTNYRRKTK